VAGAAAVLVGGGLGVLAGAGPASAGSIAGCAVTGLAADSSAEAIQLRESVAGAPVQELVGVRLDRTDGWRVAGRGDMVLVVDEAAAPLGEPVATVTMFGLSRRVDLGFVPAEDGRLVSSSGVPGLGGITRTGQLRIDNERCVATVLVAADRSPFATLAGLGGLGAAVVFGVLLVVVARRPAGGWGRRFAAAAPLGFLAGAGEAVLLYDAGTFDPAGRWSWWLPVVGVALAAGLPWTRQFGWVAWWPSSWRERRQRQAVLVPVPAAVGRWQPETLFARTERFEVWWARAAAGPNGAPARALVKVPVAGRAGEPGMRLLLAREKEVLSRVDNPHCVRLAEAPDGTDAPAAVILADVDGATLRAVVVAPAAAAAVAAVVGIAGVVVGAPPAAAATEVVTPEAALAIFVHTVDEARADDYRHLADEAVEQAEGLWAYDPALRAGALVEIVVGVPPGQYVYPAWFVATAELRAGDAVAYLHSRFDRTSTSEPWLATILGWSAHPVVAPPELDQNGWLVLVPDEPEQPDELDPAAGPPADLELVIDPAELPQRYADWYNRSLEAGEVLPDELLVIRPDLTADGQRPLLASYLLNETGNAAFFRAESSRWESVATPDGVEPTVRLPDSTTAIVSFTVVAETTRWARADDQFEPCRNSGTWASGLEGGDRRHAWVGIDRHVTVAAAVPIRQPWRGEPDAVGPVTVVIDDNWGGVRETYVPERSVPC
jgi:hypothetical protein